MAKKKRKSDRRRDQPLTTPSANEALIRLSNEMTQHTLDNALCLTSIRLTMAERNLLLGQIANAMIEFHNQALARKLVDRTRKYAIRSLTEVDDETGDRLYWSNEQGWVDFDSADRFLAEELNQLPANSDLVNVFPIEQGFAPR